LYGTACTSSNESEEYELSDEGLSAMEAGILSGALTLVAALFLLICCCGWSLYEVFGCDMCSRRSTFDLCNRRTEKSMLNVSFADEVDGVYERE
jgi:hypothetical protein